MCPDLLVPAFRACCVRRALKLVQPSPTLCDSICGPCCFAHSWSATGRAAPTAARSARGTACAPSSRSRRASMSCRRCPRLPTLLLPPPRRRLRACRRMRPLRWGLLCSLRRNRSSLACNPQRLRRRWCRVRTTAAWRLRPRRCSCSTSARLTTTGQQQRRSSSNRSSSTTGRTATMRSAASRVLKAHCQYCDGPLF